MRIENKLNILDEIAIRTKERINEKKKTLPLEKIKDMAEQAGGKSTGNMPDFSFENALRKQGINFICEIKKASPSKGIIAEDFPYVQIARDYEAAGAAAISVLTEPFWFMGGDNILSEVAQVVSVPLLRKDFTVDAYMIYEAKILRASAILLICAILSPAQLSEYIKEADRLGLSCLIEAHDEDEVKMAINAGARVIGVNNRDLKTFSVDTGNSVRLAALVPDDVIFVSESGIRSFEDVELLRRNGVNAVLIGETLMCAPDKKAALAKLRGQA
ncbi:MAG: indole-3-glycerol phosphate synthase TrpC [Treponema sp.]|jgi:indole-3-glycerol phosphate synthase|nr:indole-3-glycerol phosphate synthase TrpC [Treponema sp.]